MAIRYLETRGNHTRRVCRSFLEGSSVQIAEELRDEDIISSCAQHFSTCTCLGICSRFGLSFKLSISFSLVAFWRVLWQDVIAMCVGITVRQNIHCGYDLLLPRGMFAGCAEYIYTVVMISFCLWMCLQHVLTSFLVVVVEEDQDRFKVKAREGTRTGPTG